MTGIGLPVPGFYTIDCRICQEYFNAGNQWPAGLKEECHEEMEKLQVKMKKVFYTTDKLVKYLGEGYAKLSAADLRKLGENEKIPTPLLVSVRSGAAQSLPGMMDTILNLGINDITSQLLIGKNPSNERFVLDSYRRFVMMFCEVVMGVDCKVFDSKLNELKTKYNRKEDFELNAEEMRELVAAFLQIALEKIGRPFPQDCDEQLFLATNAVFASWNNPRAIVYRNLNKIPHDGGTAVSVCAMVFGNFNNISGSGVGFSRDPKTGVSFNYLFGEFLKNA